MEDKNIPNYLDKLEVSQTQKVYTVYGGNLSNRMYIYILNREANLPCLVLNIWTFKFSLKGLREGVSLD